VAGSPVFGVHEAVIHAFLVSAEFSVVSPPHHRIRTRSKSGKTSELIRQFVDAIEIWRTLQNDSPILRYLEATPEDRVAAEVFRWSKFLFARNRDQAIRVPRLLTSLGLFRHPCERAEGDQLAPQETTTEAELALEALQQRMKERYRVLRPPRSERRAKAAARNGESAQMDSGSHAVIEQMLSSPSQGYRVDFSASRSAASLL
jgi:hypothetical protein